MPDSDKSSGKTKRKLKIAFFIMCVLLTVTIMAVMPYGSFDPTDSGFYRSLGFGAIWSVMMSFILRHHFHSSPKPGSNKSGVVSLELITLDLLNFKPYSKDLFLWLNIEILTEEIIRIVLGLNTLQALIVFPICCFGLGFIILI